MRSDTIRTHSIDDVEELQRRKAAFVAELKTKNIAEQTKAANEQHYEVWLSGRER